MKILTKIGVFFVFITGIIWQNLRSNWDVYMAVITFALLVFVVFSVVRKSSTTTGGFRS
tara:strand:- start:571 stop:747 length:177 start_codon:yes stop_codon:yes gene_type:complete